MQVRVLVSFCEAHPCVGCTMSDFLKKSFHSNSVCGPGNSLKCKVVHSCRSLLNEFDAKFDVNLNVEV